VRGSRDDGYVPFVPRAVEERLAAFGDRSVTLGTHRRELGMQAFEPLERPHPWHPRVKPTYAVQCSNELITSLARASSVGGMARPRALAVIRLLTRSNLVGCSTGMSAGFAPRITGRSRYP
jgi:hypothetical protein